MVHDKCSEKGITLISVLFIVCLMAMAVIAAAALVTRATQTTAWSTERTRALYAAEAGLNHWLYQMTIEAGDDPGGEGDSSFEDMILALTVNGEANRIPYEAKIDEEDLGSGTYRLVSEANAGGRPVKVSLLLGQVSDAWRHVVYSTEQHHKAMERLAEKGYVVNDDSQWTIDGDDSSPVWMKNGKLVPLPIWEEDGEGYRTSLFSTSLAQWNPPEDNPVELNQAGNTVELPTNGPVYYKNSKIGKLTGNLDGDLYLEDCEIGELDINVSGNVFARSMRGEEGSGKGTDIIGDISGDVHIEESQVSKLASKPSGSISGHIIVKNSDSVLGVERILGEILGSVLIESGGITEGFTTMPSIGDSEVSTNIYGSVYLRGTCQGNESTILRIAGPPASQLGATTIHSGVFTEDASLLVEGGVDIRRRAPWPAILSDGWVIFNGVENRVEVTGPVYALANEQLSNRPGWLVDEILSACRPELLVHEQIYHNAGVMAFSDDLYGNGAPGVQIVGSIVSPGRTLLVGNVHVTYDSSIAWNPPPWFTGAERPVMLLAGTWSCWRE
jgi:hypothetical protein